MSIYFIRSGVAVKIGCTRNESIKPRLQQLQSWNPYGLELLCEAEGGIQEETKLHCKFRHLHLFDGGDLNNRLLCQPQGLEKRQEFLDVMCGLVIAHEREQ